MEGFAAAIDRASRYIEAGADITFIEAPETEEEVRRIPKLLNAPQLINLVVGGKTPILDQAALAEMGYGLVLYANAALQGAIHGMQSALRTRPTFGRLDEAAGLVATFEERQRLTQKPLFDELERRYSKN